MNIHKNARLTPQRSRADGAPGCERANAEGRRGAVGVCPRTVRKWVERYRAKGCGLADRSSRPHRLHRPTPQPVVDRIERCAASA